jgi:hypothetical protein
MDAQNIGTENESPQEAGSESTERDSGKDAPQVASDPKPTKSRVGHDGNDWHGTGGVTGI